MPSHTKEMRSFSQINWYVVVHVALEQADSITVAILVFEAFPDLMRVKHMCLCAHLTL